MWIKTCSKNQTNWCIGSPWEKMIGRDFDRMINQRWDPQKGGGGKGFEIRLDSTTYNHRYLRSQLCRMNRHISSLAMRMLQKPFQKTPSRVCPPQGDPANCRKRKGHASWLYRSIRLIFLGLQVSWARAPREELAPSQNLNTCNSSFYLEFY